MINAYEKIDPVIGDYVKPDQWYIGENLVESDSFKDSSFPGCQFRLLSHDNIPIAVNIKTTGKPHWNGFSWQSRCRVEFVQDDNQPSTFSGAWFYTNDKRRLS